jgi:hypothetical protein
LELNAKRISKFHQQLMKIDEFEDFVFLVKLRELQEFWSDLCWMIILLWLPSDYVYIW